jgi:hypothetical protein
MITYTKGNGTSKRSAIKIIGAHGEFDGIDSEYNLISLIFRIIKKDWTLLQQELYLEEDKAYDRLVIEDSDGKASDIWFDISSFFNRW